MAVQAGFESAFSPWRYETYLRRIEDPKGYLPFYSCYFLMILPFLGGDGPVLVTFHGTDVDKGEYFPEESFARTVKNTRWLRFIPCAVGSKYTEVKRIEEASGFRLVSERVESVVQYAE